MDMEEFKRFRGIRLIPVLDNHSAQYLVPGLARQVKLEGEIVNTAPYKTGVEFSLFSIGTTKPLLETGMLDVTDWIDHKVFINKLYIGLPGDQFVQAEVWVPFIEQPLGNYRQMALDQVVHVKIDSRTLSTNNTILSAVDAFTAAGIEIILGLKLSGTINLEVGDTQVYALIEHVEVKFPNYSSLDGEDIRENIYRDINAAIPKSGQIGYDLDVYRLNHSVFPERKERIKLRDYETAAASLASRY